MHSHIANCSYKKTKYCGGNLPWHQTSESTCTVEQRGLLYFFVLLMSCLWRSKCFQHNHINCWNIFIMQFAKVRKVRKVRNHNCLFQHTPTKHLPLSLPNTSGPHWVNLRVYFSFQQPALIFVMKLLFLNGFKQFSLVPFFCNLLNIYRSVLGF